MKSIVYFLENLFTYWMYSFLFSLVTMISEPPGVRSCWWVWKGSMGCTWNRCSCHRPLWLRRGESTNIPVQTDPHQWWISNPNLSGRSPKSTLESWNIHCPNNVSNRIYTMRVLQISCNLHLLIAAMQFHSRQTPCPEEWWASAASSCRKAGWRKLKK